MLDELNRLEDVQRWAMRSGFVGTALAMGEFIRHFDATAGADKTAHPVDERAAAGPHLVYVNPKRSSER